MQTLVCKLKIVPTHLYPKASESTSSLWFNFEGKRLLDYGVNDYFNHSDWLISGHITQTKGKADIDGLWKVDVLIDKSISMRSLGNSALIIGGGLVYCPRITTDIIML